MGKVVTHSLAPSNLLGHGGCYWIDVTMSKEHTALPSTLQALHAWQLIHSMTFL